MTKKIDITVTLDEEKHQITFTSGTNNCYNNCYIEYSKFHISDHALNLICRYANAKIIQYAYDRNENKTRFIKPGRIGFLRNACDENNRAIMEWFHQIDPITYDEFQSMCCSQYISPESIEWFITILNLTKEQIYDSSEIFSITLSTAKVLINKYKSIIDVNGAQNHHECKRDCYKNCDIKKLDYMLSNFANRYMRYMNDSKMNDEFKTLIRENKNKEWLHINSDLIGKIIKCQDNEFITEIMEHHKCYDNSAHCLTVFSNMYINNVQYVYKFLEKHKDLIIKRMKEIYKIEISLDHENYDPDNDQDHKLFYKVCRNNDIHIAQFICDNSNGMYRIIIEDDKIMKYGVNKFFYYECD